MVGTAERYLVFQAANPQRAADLAFKTGDKRDFGHSEIVQKVEPFVKGNLPPPCAKLGKDAPISGHCPSRQP
jgi:hypothetical protein